jgi:ATP-dependent Zn protease
MSFGRSKAKIFHDDAVKVSFSDVAGVDEAALELREGRSSS